MQKDHHLRTLDGDGDGDGGGGGGGGLDVC